MVQRQRHRTQYEHELKIVYTQDAWVAASGYRHFDTDELIQLWVLINKQICRIIKNIPEDKIQNKCLTEDLHRLEWLSDDYVEHMKHHLHQLLDTETKHLPLMASKNDNPASFDGIILLNTL